MNDFVEVWRSPLIPNGPIVVRTALGADMTAKFTALHASTCRRPTRPASSAIEGGDFTGYVPVKPEFYNADHRRP